MKLTQTQIDEAKQKLTLEAFAARQMAISSGVLMPLWLCTSSEVQHELVAQLKSAYEAWIGEELHSLMSRIENDPLSRPGVLQSQRPDGPERPEQ